MLLDVSLTGLLLVGLFWVFLRYTERQKWWTLRLKLSCWIPGRILLLFSCTGTVIAMADIVQTRELHTQSLKSLLVAILVAFGFALDRLLLPLAESRRYVNLRWTAWSGPSRTGIAPAYTRYLGNAQDWASMAASCSVTHPHPVEAFIQLASPLSSGLLPDVSDLLRERLRLDEEGNTAWIPRSERKSGTYAPFETDQPVSLLWGRGLGFRPRCSRGIIAVPKNLLHFGPCLENGVDGRPLCIAHGVLARNKGLEPHRLVCNLLDNQSLRQFEENSIFWPRPSKTLRSFYHAELDRSFSVLGTSYVTAATELALLIADASYEVMTDWLDGQMEHQDLEFNNEAAALGANADELSRLYRGHYAAMLVSLSLHRVGIRLRPELAVFKALCRRENVQEPPWLSDPAMVERSQQEDVILTGRGALLVEAII